MAVTMNKLVKHFAKPENKYLQDVKVMTLEGEVILTKGKRVVKTGAKLTDHNLIWWREYLARTFLPKPRLKVKKKVEDEVPWSVDETRINHSKNRAIEIVKQAKEDGYLQKTGVIDKDHLDNLKKKAAYEEKIARQAKNTSPRVSKIRSYFKAGLTNAEVVDLIREEFGDAPNLKWRVAWWRGELRRRGVNVKSVKELQEERCGKQA